jgi:hypothetical protein
MVFLGRCHVLDFLGQGSVSGQHFAQFDERTNDENAHLYSAVAVEDRRQHGRAVLRKSVR